jgi:hypothetical protein
VVIFILLVLFGMYIFPAVCENMFVFRAPLGMRPWLSRSDLSYFIYVFILVWSGHELGGLSMFPFLCYGISVFGLVWFSIRGSCLSLSLIVNRITMVLIGQP